jgi:hypothetical protein
MLLGHRYKTLNLSEPLMLCFGSEILQKHIFEPINPYTTIKMYVSRHFHPDMYD